MNTADRLAIFLGKLPRLEREVFIAPSATVLGDVRIGECSSVWYGAVLRGDINFISIGSCTNVQDGVVGHLADDHPLLVGDYVTVGHGAVLHACEIGDECLIGMGATILDGAKIGNQSIIAAGAVVPMGMEVPEGSLVAGVPAIIKRPLSLDKRAGLKRWAEKYLTVKEAHRKLT